MKKVISGFVLAILSGLPLLLHAQPGTFSFEIKKPQKFETKRLPSEKTGEKKFTVMRRFMQNTTTHYNYFFNANNKLNDVIGRAKTGFKDNYEELLPFYNYSLETTAQDKIELDSVIYKATAGILLHDLRNDWVDNMYLLIGRAYLLRNELDSANLTFQYLNFAFSPLEKDGYRKAVGTNDFDGKNKALSISTREKRPLIKKMFTRPPSRNDAFIWQLRTLVEQNEISEAAGLIETLRNDPFFPKRLSKDLSEMQSYWYYKQQVYDSAAKYLSAALDNAEDKTEQSRWEFLLAQLYELTRNKELASKYYARAGKHTFDPVMEVYARLNSIKLDGGTDDKAIRENISALLKMARRDKYENYRDIIYYAAAQMELESSTPNISEAEQYLLRSLKYASNNPSQRNKAFLQLADINYIRKQFMPAYNYYDSIDITDRALKDANAITERKSNLETIVTQLRIIERQDSLQRIAALPEEDRKAFVKKELRRIRKSMGLTEEDNGVVVNPLLNNNKPADLFTGNNKGEGYFNNPVLKGKGFSEFKTTWGSRPNVDNWRRISAVNSQINSGVNNDPTNAGGTGAGNNAGGNQELTEEALLANLPTTPDRLKVSNDSLQEARFELGKLYQNRLEEYRLAIETYEQLNEAFPEQPNLEATYFNLFYCYKKIGDLSKANYYKSLLGKKYPQGKFVAMANNSQANGEKNAKDPAATKKYEDIYNLFIEGKFDRALAEKKQADSIYQNNYWTPQLLYIESVYYIKQRQDSAAIVVLKNIISMNPSSALAVRAEKVIEVLGRRKEIETYLTNLQVEREKESPRQPIMNDPVVKPPVVVNNQPVTPAVNPPVVNNPAVKPADTIKTQPKPPPVVKAAGFTYDAAKPHVVVMVLDKVDTVYVIESQNAFRRYNRQTYYSQTMELNSYKVNDTTSFIIISSFANADAAAEYAVKAKKDAGETIIPWMKAEKYSFIILTPENLEILKSNKDLPGYRKLLNDRMPGKF
jgi:outer membrane protein assembly factor BamD (BamD/ComL family)